VDGHRPPRRPRDRPILGRLSVPARAKLATRLMPAMMLIMPTLAVTTLVAGWQLAGRYGYLDGGSVHHSWIVASRIVVAIMATAARLRRGHSCRFHRSPSPDPLPEAPFP